MTQNDKERSAARLDEAGLGGGEEGFLARGGGEGFLAGGLGLGFAGALAGGDLACTRPLTHAKADARVQGCFPLVIMWFWMLRVP